MRSLRQMMLPRVALFLPLLGLFAIVQSLPAAEQPTSPAAGERYYVDASRDDGLVAYWRFDETAGSGTSDASKTQAHGTLSGNAMFVSDLTDRIKFPNVRALQLDGSGDYVDTKDFDLTDNFTIALWAYPQSAGANNMIGKHDAAGGNLLLFGLYGDRYHVRIRNVTFSSDDPVTAGWQHLAVTGEKIGDSSTRIRFYRNGVENQVVTLDAVVGNIGGGRAWTIGQDWDGNSRTDYYDGLLDDIRIYDRALPTDEIVQLGYFGEDNDGKSWSDAYTTLERALGVATNGDEIWVASGIYTPARLATTEPLDPRFATFQLGIGVAHYGGFDGNETSLSQRNPDNHVTVLSGDIDGNDTTNGQGVVLDPGDIVGDNAYHVVSSLSVGDGTTTLDGFTITAGKAIYNGGAVLSKGLGGGIYHVDGSPNFIDLTIQGNEADSGGGMYAIIGQPSLSQVHFEANSADDGGGMFNNQAAPQLRDVAFHANWAADSGGGMLNTQANASLDQVIFNDNHAGSEGGGVANFASQPVFIRTTFSENESGIGGAIYNSASDMQVSFSEVVDNVASGYGGGFHNASSDLLIFSTDFSGNDGYHGGAIHNDSSSPTIQRSTFTSNSALTNGGGMSSSGAGAPKLSQVAFSGNSAGVNGGGIYQSGGEFALYNAFFETNTAGISGGGGYFLGSTTKVGNAVFLANAADSGEGGGFVNSDSFMQMSNVTVAQNSAGSVGGGAFISGLGSDGSLLANSIFWGNEAGALGPEIYITGGFAITETFNLISGTVGVSPDSPFEIDPDPGPDETWGTGDDDLGYLRPKEMSQATDAGSNSYVLEDVLDLDGDGDAAEALPLDVGQFRRIYNGTVDIGAYEWGLVFRYLSLIQK